MKHRRDPETALLAWKTAAKLLQSNYLITRRVKSQISPKELLSCRAVQSSRVYVTPVVEVG